MPPRSRLDPNQIDFDDIDMWAPSLSRTLSAFVSDSVKKRIRDAAPRYVEDARDLLFQLAGRDRVIDATLDWIRASSVLAYHGTRLNDAELRSLHSAGLQPLQAKSRRERLARALSSHPRWETVRQDLDAAIERHGSGNFAGRREGQVHLTLSRNAIVNGFNHYLKHGSEFDQHVAYAMLGAEGKELLCRDGAARLLTIAVPGVEALNAAHPHFTIEDVRSIGDTPNIANEFLKAWSYRMAHQSFQSRRLEVDCGMVFRSPVPPAWITRVETLRI